MRHPILLLAVVFAGASLFAAPLAAQDDDDDSEDEDLAEARELYEVGNAHYAAGRYEKAAAAFQKGYQLSELPGFLYNLANAYERMGNYAKAADKLEIYLKSPKAKDVVSVRERVKRLRAAADDLRREERKRKAREEQEKKFADRERDREKESAQYVDGPRSPTFLYFLGGGAAALAAGGTFGLLSKSAANDAAAGCIGALCNRDAQSSLDREKSFAVIADVSIGVGIALVGVGAYLYLKGPPRRRIDNTSDKTDDADDSDADDDDDDELGLVPTIGPNSIGITAIGRF